MREEPPWDDLDPGIRDTVRWCWDNGFEPTDSGDGSKAAWMEGALDVPHVFMQCIPDDLIDESRRLWRLATDVGLVKANDEAPMVEASYSPDDGVAILTLYGRLP